MKRRQAGKSVIGNEVKSKISCLSYIFVQGSFPECFRERENLDSGYYSNNYNVRWLLP